MFLDLGPDLSATLHVHVPFVSGPFINLLHLSSRACGLHGRWTLNLTSCVVCPRGIGLQDLKLSAGDVTTTRLLIPFGEVVARVLVEVTLCEIGIALMNVPWRLRFVETVKQLRRLNTVNLLSLVLG